MIPKLWLTSALAAAAVVAAAHTSARAGDWRSSTDPAVIGAGYAAGEAIGTAAVGGPGGSNSVGYGGAGRSDRPCTARRPVYNESGTFIGYRGQQLC